MGQWHRVCVGAGLLDKAESSAPNAHRIRYRPAIAGNRQTLGNELENIASALGQGHGLLCPACKVDLVMSERQGIEIDYCPKCRGVWLDRGELDKIIERNASEDIRSPRTPQSAPQGQPYPPQGYDGGHGSGHGGGHGRSRGHGSFLGRLFD